MADTVQALQELLKLIADHPELADRITITIKPTPSRAQAWLYEIGYRKTAVPKESG